MGFTRDIPTPLNIPNTAVKRDSNSEFAVTKIVGNLQGNATTADDGISEVSGGSGLTLVLSNKTLTATLDTSVLGSDLIVSKSGLLVGERPALNFIPGTNVSLTVTDDAINDRVNVTIASTASGTLTSAETVGTGAGPAVYKQTLGGVLQFRKVNAASTKVSVAVDGNDGVGVDIVPGNIDHDDLAGSGTFSHSEIDIILADLSPADAGTLAAQALTSAGTTKFTGILASSGTATYKSGNPAGTSVAYIQTDATFTLTTPSTTTAVNKGDQGTLALFVNNVSIDSFNLAAVFEEALRGGSQTYPATAAGNSAGGRIDIVSVDKYNNFSAYQKLVATFSFIPALFVEGYNTIHVVHLDQTSATYEFFYDNDAGSNPSVGTPTLGTPTVSSSKYLSGIRYVSTSDTITLTVVGSNLFNNVYVNPPLAYSSMTGVPNGSILITDGAVTGVSNPAVKGQTMTVTNKSLTFSTASVCSNNARITLTPSDPYGSYTTSQSASSNILVSTFATIGNSTAISENFRDENYRLPLSFDSSSTVLTVTGQWTSSDALTNGNCQQYFTGTTTHALVYPTINFTTGYIPTQTGRNYSTFTGNQQYARAFVPSVNKTGITLTINGVGTSTIGSLGTNNVNIEVKLPTQTGWLDAAVAYNSGLGVASDGLGCLSGSIAYASGNATMTLTFGGKTTGDAGGRMYIRVTMRNSTSIISSITTNW